MINLDAAIGDMKDIKFFASIDFVTGYWQLPVAEESQSLHAFMTNNAVVCVLPRCKEATTVAQTCKENLSLYLQSYASISKPG